MHVKPNKRNKVPMLNSFGVVWTGILQFKEKSEIDEE